MPELLAVYGTLMAGQAYQGRPEVDEILAPIGPCRIPGVLHCVGDYPCLVEGPGEVAGELYEILDPAALATLDAYEDDEYERRRVRLVEPEREAWVYVWVAEPPGEPIDAGDWRTFLALRGNR
jgi:gamma-glutamylcyclotransferase (GGCT)/AIG2-like uncharacterized protein YtfP